MGLSFQDKLSLVESVGILRFEAANPNEVPGNRSISLDGSLHAGPHHPNAILKMTSIEERRDDNIGGDDNIQIVLIRSTDSSDKILQIKHNTHSQVNDSCMYHSCSMPSSHKKTYKLQDIRRRNESMRGFGSQMV
jgi:hypothetical protein